MGAYFPANSAVKRSKILILRDSSTNQIAAFVLVEPGCQAESLTHLANTWLDYLSRRAVMNCSCARRCRATWWHGAQLIGWPRHSALFTACIFDVRRSHLLLIDTFQNKIFADQHHLTILRLKFRAHRDQVDQVDSVDFNCIAGSS